MFPGMATHTKINLPTNMSLDQWKTVGGCVVRVLRDSNRTEDIVTSEELAAQAQLHHLKHSGVMTGGEGPDIMRERPHFGDVDFDALRALPATTLLAPHASVRSPRRAGRAP